MRQQTCNALQLSFSIRFTESGKRESTCHWCTAEAAAAAASFPSSCYCSLLGIRLKRTRNIIGAAVLVLVTRTMNFFAQLSSCCSSPTLLLLSFSLFCFNGKFSHSYTKTASVNGDQGAAQSICVPCTGSAHDPQRPYSTPQGTQALDSQSSLEPRVVWMLDWRASWKTRPHCVEATHWAGRHYLFQRAW